MALFSELTFTKMKDIVSALDYPQMNEMKKYQSLYEPLVDNNVETVEKIPQIYFFRTSMCLGWYKLPTVYVFQVCTATILKPEE